MPHSKLEIMHLGMVIWSIIAIYDLQLDNFTNHARRQLWSEWVRIQLAPRSPLPDRSLAGPASLPWPTATGRRLGPRVSPRPPDDDLQCSQCTPLGMVIFNVCKMSDEEAQSDTSLLSMMRLIWDKLIDDTLDGAHLGFNLYYR